MIWSKDEINYLVENYSNTKNEELSKKLKRSIASISNMAGRLKLKKSKEHKSKMISLRNKSFGRDLNDSFVKKIALKYTNKSEFKSNDPSCYSYANKNGIMDEICSHMLIQSFSKPQLICKFIFDKILGVESSYNNRKIIPPYELDIYYHDLKIAIEYNGKYYHNSMDNTELKKDMCNDLGILLIVLNETSRSYEKDIKKSITDVLPIINKHINKNIKNDVVYNIEVTNNVYERIYSHETFFRISQKYDTLSDFRTSETRIYAKICKLGLLDKYTSHMKRKTKKWNNESIKEEVSKYVYLQDFIDNSKGCYLHVYRFDKKYLIKHLKYKKKNI